MPIMPQPGTTVAIPYLHDPDDVFYIRLPPRYSFFDQVFSYTPAGEKTLHIQIGKVWRMVSADPSRFEFKTVGIVSNQARFIIQNSGINPNHLSRIDPLTWDNPGLLLHFPDDAHCIIDGNHRYALRFLQRKKTMDFIEVKLDDIQKCLLDLPQDFGLDPHQRGWGDRVEQRGFHIGPDGRTRK